MSLWPRRRDVRDIAEDVLAVLMDHFDDDEEEFDREFLTEVRDLMRDGVSFTDAVLAIANAEETPEPDMQTRAAQYAAGMGPDFRVIF